MGTSNIITAILAVGCIMLGVGISITSCPAMAAQPQQEWTLPVHKKPVVHKATPVPQARPVEAPAPKVCPVLPPALVAAPAPPPAPREPSYWERARTHGTTAWDWIKWPLGGLVIGGALASIFNACRSIYAGYKAANVSIAK